MTELDSNPGWSDFTAHCYIATCKDATRDSFSLKDVARPPWPRERTHLLRVALSHLQHRQVVVGLGVAVVVGQSQPEALMRQIRISRSLQKKSSYSHTQIHTPPPASSSHLSSYKLFLTPQEKPQVPISGVKCE